MQKQKNSNTLTKKIGGTTYTVRIHFNENSKEQFSDKLLRIIKNDIVHSDNPKPVA